MTFHKAKEESKWKQWKEQEERILRKSGVSEEVIQRLRELDWQDFNAERRFWEHFSSSQEELYTRELEEPSSVVLNIQQLLDSVENEQLLQVLLESDKKTLQILLLKMWGFSVREIAGQMGLAEKTIYTRIERLKKWGISSALYMKGVIAPRSLTTTYQHYRYVPKDRSVTA